MKYMYIIVLILGIILTTMGTALCYFAGHVQPLVHKQQKCFDKLYDDKNLSHEERQILMQEYKSVSKELEIWRKKQDKYLFLNF